MCIYIYIYIYIYLYIYIYIYIYSALHTHTHTHTHTLSEYVNMQASGQVETVRAGYMAKQKELESTNSRLTARLDSLV